ncbi:gas vesicle protein GvpN [Alteribacter aurantiacus]|uniref:gas vesicle protein GvpN n=1 Tax=Alteribacter aurantiacus TaxID=254410 RepID=UPI00040E3480|nr:gas vesicle protein GvpN [Alteribacter aurantiacus]
MVLKKLMNKDSDKEKDQKTEPKKQQSAPAKKQPSSKQTTKKESSTKNNQSNEPKGEEKSQKTNEPQSKENKGNSHNNNKDQTKDNKDKTQNNKDQHEENTEPSKKKQNIDLDNFVVTSDIESLVERSKQYLKAGYPVHFTGPAGVGKTSLALYLASQYEEPVLFLQGNHEMNNVDLIGGSSGFTSSKSVDNFIRSVYKHEERVNENWNEGHLVKAVKNGYTVIYDEFTRSKPETNNLLLSLLEEGILPLYGSKQKDAFVRAHPNFKMIFTSNPEEYAGVFQSQDALRDRLITLELNRGSTETEIKMVQERSGIKEDEAKVIVQLVESIRQLCEKQEVQGPSFRGSVMIGEIAKQNNIEIKADNDAFISLCKDVLGASVARCLGKKEASTKIADELKKL